MVKSECEIRDSLYLTKLTFPNKIFKNTVLFFAKYSVFNVYTYYILDMI